MRLILHIGMPKTGTTAIQRFLLTNPEELAKRGYGMLEGIGVPSNKLLAVYFSGKKPQQIAPDFAATNHLDTVKNKDLFMASSGFISEIDRQLAILGESCHTVVISSEQLSQHLLTKSELCELREWSQRRFHNVQIICVVRDPIHGIPSLWTEAVRAGARISLSRFVFKTIKRLKSSNSDARNNPLALASLWSEVFGRDALNIYFYPKGQEDVCKLFADSFLGGHHGFKFEKKRQRTSPPQSTTNAWRLANLISTPRYENRQRRSENIQLRRFLAGFAKKSRKRASLTSSQRRRVDSAYSHIFSRLETEYDAKELGSTVE